MFTFVLSLYFILFYSFGLNVLPLNLVRLVLFAFSRCCFSFCVVPAPLPPLVKALELKQNYALAYILKGSLVLAEGDLVEAPKHFSQANNIRKDIYSYKGEGGNVDTVAVVVT